LLEIAEILDTRALRLEDQAQIRRKLEPALHAALCPRFSALAIQVLKRIAFIPGSKRANWLFTVINDLWHDGRRQQAVWEKDRPSLPLILDPERLLAGWKEDLPGVVAERLASYARVLSCEGLHEAAAFPEAVGDLEDRIKAEAHRDPSLAAEVAEAFISDVLSSLLDADRAKLMEHLPLAAELAAKAAMGGGGVGAVKQLDILMQRIALPLKNGDGSLPPEREKGGAYRQVYDHLNYMYREASRDVLQQLVHTLSRLMAAAGGWPERPPRRLAHDCGATIEAAANGSVHEWTGQVVDLCDKGHGYHIRFDTIKHCWHTSPEPIQGAPGIQGVQLHVNDPSANDLKFRQARVCLHLPASSYGGANGTSETEAFPVRGWDYAEPKKVGATSGAAFWIREEPEHVRQYRESLPVFTGTLVPLPFESGPEAILDGIRSFLAEQADVIRFQSGWQALWSGRKPASERAVDGYMRHLLREYVEARGGHLSPQEHTGTGRCDYVVSRESDIVAIELKHSAGRWRQGVTAQLATYMADEKTSHGLLVVFAFKAKFRPRSGQLHELLRRRDEVCKKRGVRIDVAVLDCDKPPSASKRRKPPQPGEGFGYFPWAPDKRS